MENLVSIYIKIAENGRWVSVMGIDLRSCRFPNGFCNEPGTFIWIFAIHRRRRMG